MDGHRGVINVTDHRWPCGTYTYIGMGMEGEGREAG
jgi:hypothetical protein